MPNTLITQQNEETIGECEALILAANLYEAGHEISEELQSARKYSAWNLSYIAQQCRELNQVSIELGKVEAILNEYSKPYY